MNLLPILILLRTLFASVELAQVIQPFTPHLDADTRIQYSWDMVTAARMYGLDEDAIAAVSLHESHMENLPKNRTNDYGVMQVHWQKADCLKGLTRADLMDPRLNFDAGACELAHWKRYHASTKTEQRVWEKSGRTGKMIDHSWYGHYKHGNVVPSKRYGKAIQSKLDQLKRRRNKLHRSRQTSTS